MAANARRGEEAGFVLWLEGGVLPAISIAIRMIRVAHHAKESLLRPDWSFLRVAREGRM